MIIFYSFVSWFYQAREYIGTYGRLAEEFWGQKKSQGLIHDESIGGKKGDPARRRHPGREGHSPAGVVPALGSTAGGFGRAEIGVVYVDLLVAARLHCQLRPEEASHRDLLLSGGTPTTKGMGAEKMQLRQKATPLGTANWECVSVRRKIVRTAGKLEHNPPPGNPACMSLENGAP